MRATSFDAAAFGRGASPAHQRIFSSEKINALTP